MRWLSRFAAWFLLCLALPVSAAPPHSIEIVYDVYMGGMQVGRIDERYSRERDRYTLTSTTTPLGLLAAFKPGKVFLRSSGLVGDRGLQPLLFSRTQEHDPGREIRAEFDWQAGSLALTNPGLSNRIALPPGTQDRLSAMYQFMFLSLEGSTALDFPMTNGSKLDNYHYATEHGPILDTPAGRLDTLYLDSQSKPGESRTEIWLAARHHHLPCKMVVTEGNGDRFTQTLRSLVIKP